MCLFSILCAAFCRTHAFDALLIEPQGKPRAAQNAMPPIQLKHLDSHISEWVIINLWPSDKLLRPQSNVLTVPALPLNHKHIRWRFGISDGRVHVSFTPYTPIVVCTAWINHAPGTGCGTCFRLKVQIDGIQISLSRRCLERRISSVRRYSSV